MFEDFVPNMGIVVACYVLGMLLKNVFGKNEKVMSCVPWIVALAGMGFALTEVFFQHGMTQDRFYMLLAEGAVSGLASCGFYQIGHQAKKYEIDTEARKLAEWMEENDDDFDYDAWEECMREFEEHQMDDAPRIEEMFNIHEKDDDE